MKDEPQRSYRSSVVKGTLISLLIGCVLGMGITPSQVAILPKGEKTSYWVSVAPGLYWLNVIGIAVWITLLGMVVTLISCLGYHYWWNRRKIINKGKQIENNVEI
ncbi:hypothetical protein SAMN05444487_105187 [Marininema mesophilum]|uniref:Uncharacterized protein n=1 Tax=Marininema mesophilum TaxID=1048340 RepID=A0A1H2VRK2_9BACL|nr:hypothetical protein [Marininema mesophilum]SDW70921.1 hypothetical protein SAMN05444487_105187 [Marininema mesophilum]